MNGVVQLFNVPDRVQLLHNFVVSIVVQRVRSRIVYYY